MRVRMSVQAVHDFYATQRRGRSWLRRECRCEGTVEAGGLVSLGCFSVLLAEYAATVNDTFSQMTMTTTKQIDHKAYIPAELSRFDRYPQLFLSFPSLFSPLCFSSGAPSQLWDCPTSQPAWDIWDTLGLWDKREGAAGSYQNPGDQQICSVCMRSDLSWALSSSTAHTRLMWR